MINKRIESVLKFSVLFGTVLSFVLVSVIILLLYFTYVCEVTDKGWLFILFVWGLNIAIHLFTAIYLCHSINKKQYDIKEVYVKKKEKVFFKPKSLISPYWITYSNREKAYPTNIYVYDKTRSGQKMYCVTFKGLPYYIE